MPVACAISGTGAGRGHAARCAADGTHLRPLTGAAEHGGLQIIAFPMKRERYEQMLRPSVHPDYSPEPNAVHSLASESAMGLAPGGRMRQEIYDDPYGLDAWDQRHASRCFISILNFRQWQAITGEHPPAEPPTYASYAAAGLPRFDYYRDLEAVDSTAKLKGISSVAAVGAHKGETPLPNNETISRGNIVPLGSHRPAPEGRQVREMS